MLFTTVPVRPLRTTSFDRRFDRTFAHLANLALGSATFDRPTTPALSASWNEGTYVLTVDLPGVPEEALSVSVAGRTLVLDVATDNLSWNERIRLPLTLDVDATTANYANGRLTVTVPSAPEAQPRQIEVVHGAPAAAELDAGSRSVRRQPDERHRVTELVRQLPSSPAGDPVPEGRPASPPVSPPHRRPPPGGRRPRTG